MAFSTLIVVCLLALAGGDDARLTETQKTELARYFGFDQFQVYKIKPGIQNLRLADLDGDGRDDVLLWNAYQSRGDSQYDGVAKTVADQFSNWFSLNHRGS